MSTAALEEFLARLYVDDKARARFLQNPRREAQAAGLTETECCTLERIDRFGLQLAVDSFAKKRAQIGRKRRSGVFSFLYQTFVRYFLHPS